MTVCERLAAVILLLLALPLLAVCALVLWLLSGRTPLIAHRRVGWQGTPLRMLKLRTMWGGEARRGAGWIEHIDDDRGPELKSAADSRVACRFARFCRRHSIDELPQLWHVISGEMSLVGPRPITERELQRVLWRARRRNSASQARARRAVADLGAQPADLRRALPAGSAPGARAQHPAILRHPAAHPARGSQRRKFLVTLRPGLWNPGGRGEAWLATPKR